MNVREMLQRAPKQPGVYVMRDGGQRPLYVGKAKNLQQRVRAYLTPEKQSPKNQLLLRQVEGVEYIVTDTEVEALILENSLIKKWRPRYNISLRDDKTYPFLRLSVQETYPTLSVVMNPSRDGARYFGPYVPAGAMRKTLDLLRKIFPLRRCRGELGRKKRPCLNFQMGRCLGPCAENVSADEYREMVRGVTLFLRGQGGVLVKDLRKKMKEMASQQRYEEAAELRDRMQAVEATLEKQKAHFPGKGDMDVFGIAGKGERSALSVLQIRGGRILGSIACFFNELLDGRGEAETLGELVRAFYSSRIDIPPLIVLDGEPEGVDALEAWLTGMSSSRVRIKVPKRGELKSMVHMAARNALNTVEREKEDGSRSKTALSNIAFKAGMRGQVSSIAAVDVSNVSGTETVASIVWWEGGEFQKDRYRRLRTRKVQPGDDCGAVYETVERMTDKILSGEWTPPDVLLIDGGRGQLRAAKQALSRGDGFPVLLLSIAKPGDQGGTDRIYVSGRRDRLSLAPRSAELLLLQRVRDEAHRFALSYHRRRRDQQLKRSIIDEVPGMGSARKKNLLRKFGSVKKVREASLEDLEAVPGLPRTVARSLYETLRK